MAAAEPEPLAVTVLLPPLALCRMVMVALRAPVADGVKMTFTVQLALMATTLQLELTAKSGSLDETPDTASGKVPVLVTVICCAGAAVPGATAPKLNVGGDTCATGWPVADVGSAM